MCDYFNIKNTKKNVSPGEQVLLGWNKVQCLSRSDLYLL